MYGVIHNRMDTEQDRVEDLQTSRVSMYVFSQAHG